MLNNFDIFAITYLHSICAVNFMKNATSCGLYKKDKKKYLMKILILAWIFSFQHRSHKKSIFHETALQACTLWRSTCELF
jgi:hypothetical protein